MFGTDLQIRSDSRIPYKGRKGGAVRPIVLYFQSSYTFNRLILPVALYFQSYKTLIGDGSGAVWGGGATAAPFERDVAFRKQMSWTFYNIRSIAPCPRIGSNLKVCSEHPETAGLYFLGFWLWLRFLVILVLKIGFSMSNSYRTLL